MMLLWVVLLWVVYAAPPPPELNSTTAQPEVSIVSHHVFLVPTVAATIAIAQGQQFISDVQREKVIRLAS